MSSKALASRLRLRRSLQRNQKPPCGHGLDGDGQRAQQRRAEPSRQPESIAALVQGATYAGFIKGELDREFARREALNARASSAVTASTGLATLAFAALSLVKAQTHSLHGADAAFGITAVLFMLTAAALAVVAGLNLRYDVTSAETLDRMLGDHWGDSETTALSATCSRYVISLQTLRDGNNKKVRALVASQASLTAAVLALAICLMLVI